MHRYNDDQKKFHADYIPLSMQSQFNNEHSSGRVSRSEDKGRNGFRV